MLNAILFVFIALTLALLVAAQMGKLAGQAPPDLGITDGRLKPPSETRNSVSSQAALFPDHPQRVYAQIDALPLKAEGPEASIVALSSVLKALPGVRIVEQRGDYLRAESETRWMRFVDDMEFWVNPTRSVVELRSASRIGRKDFGANRARIEKVRSAYATAP